MNEKNLHPYQVTAVDHVIDNDAAGLFMDMGLGKTVSTLTAINRLTFEELEISRVLIIAPKRVVEMVWKEEAANWDHLRRLTFSKVIGNDQQRRAALAAKANIYLISRDNVGWICGLYGGLMLPFDMLVVDESSSFKNPKSLRFKALRKVQPSFGRVVILTGTPAPNGLIDLWPQLYLLDRGERLGKTMTAYREKYFRPGQRNGAIVYNYKIRESADDEIHDVIKDICISMKAEDYLDMAEKADNVIRLRLPEKIRRQYLEFEREQVLELMEGDITALNAAALSNKLLQFANGAVYDEDRNVHGVHDVKLDALEEIVESANGKPVLVAWTYKHDRDRILHRLRSYKPTCFSTSEHQRKWNAGKIPVLLMHPASGGHGLNLQAGGNIVVWFGNTWSLELEQQLNARLYRQGQKAKTVFIHRLVTEGTLDDDVIKSLLSKTDKQNGLMTAIKAKIAKYGKLER
jgi:SNF2 family DNA or RNA helicase